MNETAVIVSLVSLLVGFAIGWQKTRAQAFQNRGEAELSRALMARFAPPDYHLMNHVTLRVKSGTTQIDHILVSRFGVFVIETKDFNGWIYGSSEDRHWTQVTFHSKYRFQNPIRQNYKHVCAVQELLAFLPPEVILSIVVFTGTAKFKTAMPRGVLNLEEFLIDIAQRTREVVSFNQVQFCVGRLETARLSITDKTDVEHVQHLRKRWGGREKDWRDK